MKKLKLILLFLAILLAIFMLYGMFYGALFFFMILKLMGLAAFIVGIIYLVLKFRK